MKAVKITASKPLRQIVSNTQEKNVAKSLNGIRTVNSGATPFIKGDVIVGQVIIECKTTTKVQSSIAVRKSWIDEINEEKIGMGKALSAVAISFDMGENSYYVIDENAMKMLIDLVNDGG